MATNATGRKSKSLSGKKQEQTERISNSTKTTDDKPI